jgi:hypothetical protein
LGGDRPWRFAVSRGARERKVLCMSRRLRFKTPSGTALLRSRLRAGLLRSQAVVGAVSGRAVRARLLRAKARADLHRQLLPLVSLHADLRGAPIVKC